jgi:hypothetical protein
MSDHATLPQPAAPRSPDRLEITPAEFLDLVRRYAAQFDGIQSCTVFFNFGGGKYGKHLVEMPRPAPTSAG